MPVSRYPPRRSVRAAFPDTAPASGVWRQTACWDRDARYGAWDSIAWPKTGNATTLDAGVGSDAARRETHTARLRSGSSSSQCPSGNLSVEVSGGSFPSSLIVPSSDALGLVIDHPVLRMPHPPQHHFT